jgi:hypothetical protein
MVRRKLPKRKPYTPIKLIRGGRGETDSRLKKAVKDSRRDRATEVWYKKTYQKM